MFLHFAFFGRRYRQFIGHVLMIPTFDSDWLQWRRKFSNIMMASIFLCTCSKHLKDQKFPHFWLVIGTRHKCCVRSLSLREKAIWLSAENQKRLVERHSTFLFLLACEIVDRFSTESFPKNLKSDSRSRRSFEIYMSLALQSDCWVVRRSLEDLFHPGSLYCHWDA